MKPTRAVEVCRRLMEQFASELDFDIKCWSFLELAEPDCARHAAKTAGAADIILLAMPAPAFPAVLERWLDVFFATRFRTDGALALVLNEPDSSAAALEKLLARLEQLAGRLGMDFVSLLSGNEAAVLGILPTEDWPATGVPLEIPDRPHADHWGLNE